MAIESVSATPIISRFFKKAECGEIPVDWATSSIGANAITASGTTPARARAKEFYEGGTIPWVRTTDLNNHLVKKTSELITEFALLHTGLKLYPPGSVLVAMYGGYNQIGRTGMLTTYSTINQALTVIQPDSMRLVGEYLICVLNYHVNYWQAIASSSRKDPNITRNDVKKFPLALPSVAEQKIIAAALFDVVDLIGVLEQLLAKKQQIKAGAMYELLTGKRRLPGFLDQWKLCQICDISYLSTAANSVDQNLPVLTCSKHFGFVDSLSYFKNQVFSNDTRKYKIILRGQIGYPANHIEEGAIGLQDCYDKAIVSPIYVVFSVAESVNSYFLQRLLKLDRYRCKFQTATNSSVSRRGSLRWPEFSKIEVAIPPIAEQDAIAEVLSQMEQEITAIETKITKARHLKQAMMQKLLTGQIRLVPPSTEEPTP